MSQQKLQDQLKLPSPPENISLNLNFLEQNIKQEPCKMPPPGLHKLDSPSSSQIQDQEKSANMINYQKNFISKSSSKQSQPIEYMSFQNLDSNNKETIDNDGQSRLQKSALAKNINALSPSSYLEQKCQLPIEWENIEKNQEIYQPKECIKQNKEFTSSSWSTLPTSSMKTLISNFGKLALQNQHEKTSQTFNQNIQIVQEEQILEQQQNLPSKNSYQQQQYQQQQQQQQSQQSQQQQQLFDDQIFQSQLHDLPYSSPNLNQFLNYSQNYYQQPTENFLQNDQQQQNLFFQMQNLQQNQSYPQKLDSWSAQPKPTQNIYDPFLSGQQNQNYYNPLDFQKPIPSQQYPYQQQSMSAQMLNNPNQAQY